MSNSETQSGTGGQMTMNIFAPVINIMIGGGDKAGASAGGAKKNQDPQAARMADFQNCVNPELPGANDCPSSSSSGQDEAKSMEELMMQFLSQIFAALQSLMSGGQEKLFQSSGLDKPSLQSDLFSQNPFASSGGPMRV